MTAKREFKPRYRKSGFRDCRLIIISTEGTRTEKTYFEEMASPRYYHNPRVHVKVLDRLTNASSPHHIMAMLNAFQKEFSLKKDDELWMVIDLDRWRNRELSTVAAQCQQKCYELAVSNPCFEFWLLLHVKSVSDYTEEELQEFEENQYVSPERTCLEKELVNVLGSYNKARLNASAFLPFVDNAIQQAKVLDTHPEHRWPNCLGTRVYRLAESIQQ